MKLFKLSVAALGCALAVGFASCQKEETKTDVEAEDSDVVTTEALSFELKSANKNYKITDPESGDSYALTLSATVQWPDEISDYDLTKLQDSLIYIVAGQKMESINEAMTKYVGDYKACDIGSDKATVEEVDSLSGNGNERTFFSQLDVTFSEITGELITYNINYEKYVGGAHGQSGAASLTYNLDTQEFITTKWLFTDPGSAELLDAIKATIAEVSGMSVSELEQSALITPIPVSDNVSIKNGMIVFHYNPYSVLPYSYGQIDASLSPYLLQNLLTPQAKALLISE